MKAKNKTSNTQSLSPVERAGERYLIYHNIRCSKSREACSILQKKNIPFETIEYLKKPPSQNEIKELLKKLGCKIIPVFVDVKKPFPRKAEPTPESLKILCQDDHLKKCWN